MNEPAESNIMLVSQVNNSGADLEDLDYLRGVKSSTCLLLPTTPSPHPMDFQHPLSDQMSEGPFLTLDDDPNGLQNLDTSAGDSSSSVDSNSVTNVQDPVSAQLINNISMLEYQTLSKNGDLIMGQTDDVKLNGNLNMSSRKLPGFVNWNWIIIRKVLLWVVISGLVACLGAIIAMVITIPTDCNPNLPWHQGKVFYEIFPASFKDSNNDGIGDLKGLLKKLDYIEDLGVSAIRLNHIFEANHYPEHYYNSTSLLKIDRSIGTLKDFQALVGALHRKNMHLVLDIPVMSMASPVSSPNVNATRTVLLANNSLVGSFDDTSAAIAFWARAQNVDGFYLKHLEDFVEDVNFIKTLQIWKHLIGSGKILIASEEAYKKAKGESLNVLLSRIDLIDVHLDASHDTNVLKDRINEVISGTLWSKPQYPWVHWNIGNIHSGRVSTKSTNNTLALTALEFSLPGTVSIFYGDEIGLGDVSLQEVERDFHDHEHVYNLVPMAFADIQNVESAAILSWISKSSKIPNYQYIDVIKSLIQLRLTTPTIYLRSIFKEGNVLKNTEIRKTEDDLVVIERWFPRRNTCVFVGNLGKKPITTDLTSMFYGGTVVAGTNRSLVGQVLLFDEITFPPNSGIILKLEK